MSKDRDMDLANFDFEEFQQEAIAKLQAEALPQHAFGVILHTLLNSFC